MGEWTIWHNPRCSKSRRALELLRERSIEPVVVSYLEAPPGLAEIERALSLLGIEPRDLMRRGEPVYAQLGLDDERKTRGELIAAMVENPILIERPIVFRGDRAVIGRPPERIEELL